MGLDYAYHLVFPMQSIDPILKAISARLIKANREPLLAALPWRPRKASQFMLDEEVIHERFDMENFPDYFSMSFPSDDVLKSYLEDEGESKNSMEDGSIRLPINFSIFAGEKMGLITFAAPTTGISRVFYGSNSVRRSFIEIAASMEAIGVFLDLEINDGWWLLYPQDRWITCPDLEHIYWYSDGEKPQFFEKALVKITAEIASEFWISMGYLRLFYNTREGQIIFRCEYGTMASASIRVYFPALNSWDMYAPSWVKERRWEVFERISRWLETQNASIVVIDDNCFVEPAATD